MNDRFMFRAENYDNGLSPEWGIRRADGGAWRTAPSEEGKADYYQASDEVSSGGEVLFCSNALDAIAAMLSQREDDDVPHPGLAVVVRRRFQEGPGGWGYWFSDVSPEDLVREVTSTIHLATRLLPELAVALHVPAGDPS